MNVYCKIVVGYSGEGIAVAGDGTGEGVGVANYGINEVGSGWYSSQGITHLLNPPLVVEAKLLGIDVAGELAVK
jgi:hypothetical protein